MSERAGRRVIVLGALSAMAEETCRLIAAEGGRLALFARNAERLEAVAQDLRARGAADVACVARDLAEAQDAGAALNSAAEKLDGVDCILLFYGVLGDQVSGESDANEATRIIEVNFTSAALWCLAGAALLERQASDRGVLIVVTSVAGDRGRRSNYIYGAAKGGLSILVQGIAHRFAARRPGLRAVAIKAGFVDTPMTAHLKKGGPLWESPRRIAAVIFRAMEKGGPVIYAPFLWRWIMLAVRLVPAPIFNKANF